MAEIHIDFIHIDFWVNLNEYHKVELYTFLGRFISQRCDQYDIRITKQVQIAMKRTDNAIFLNRSSMIL